VNNAVDECYKDRFDTITGKTIEDIYPEKEALIVRALDNEVINSKKAFRRQINIYTKDGYQINDLSRAPILNKKGEVIAIISTSNDITEFENIKKALEQKNNELYDLTEKYRILSYIDDLTKIYNRRKFYEDISSLDINIKHCLILTDLNNFKLVNDELGHSVGDNVLFDFAALIKVLTSKYNGNAYRLGGDEFALLYQSQLNMDIPKEINEINIILSKYHEKLSASYGFTILNDQDALDSVAFDLTFKRADSLMYEYKKKLKEPF